MSLTTCIRKAGAALNTDDKAAILKAAAAYRKQGLGATEAARKAVDERIVAVQEMLRERERQVAEAQETQPEMDAMSAELPAAEATHADPGEPAEAVTPEVVAEVIEKAAKKTGRTRSEMKAKAARDKQTVELRKRLSVLRALKECLG
jgi:hypothetical protein